MPRQSCFCSLLRTAVLTLLSLTIAPGLPLCAQTNAAPATATTPNTTQQFFVRLIPPRATFPADITSDEKALMQQHAAYWAEQFKAGKVLILGPVDDPKGTFGMAVLECTQTEAQALANGDPSVKAGLNKIEVMPMHVFLRKP